jgi:starch synthase (maltosyl-transferring)
MKQPVFLKNYQKNGRSRVIIENISPQVDGGRYPAKRTVGEIVEVHADVYSDGHDHVTPVLLHRRKGEKKWKESAMCFLENDRWTGTFEVSETGKFEFAVKAFINHVETWIDALKKRITAGGDEKELDVQLKIGVLFLKEIQAKYKKSKVVVIDWIDKLTSADTLQNAVSSEFESFLYQHPLIGFETTSEAFPIVVHRKRAGFSAWYSFFPRSASLSANTHGTFSDCEKLLPRIKELGFDVVYFPPVHPIGHAFRKGKNNSLDIQPGEPGCPYATGNEFGGHKDILSDLGSLKDFKHLIAETEKHGMEVAMDFAIQCSPDHPYVKEHPQWFKWRPDGTVQYAENPPKKYQDVLPLDFENDDWQNMWVELKGILEYWIGHGIRIFRVDNPHTKNFIFWQWCLEELDVSYPDVIFLSEAFTRPRIMENLAKKGYHQSYTYFTWRNNKSELMQYMHELTQTNMREYFRPNFWPNTHDINPYILQSGHEPQYIIRFFLAATLSSNYGIFGPCYELMDHAALPGKEEYLDSEKYEVRSWDWNKRNKLMQIMTLVNKARNENPALQFTNNYQSCHVDNDQMMAWAKVFGENKIVCVVCLDAYSKQSATVHLPLHTLGMSESDSYVVHDLISGDQYVWNGSRNYVELDPNRIPFHLFRIEK